MFIRTTQKDNFSRKKQDSFNDLYFNNILAEANGNSIKQSPRPEGRGNFTYTNGKI